MHTPACTHNLCKCVRERERETETENTQSSESAGKTVTVSERASKMRGNGDRDGGRDLGAY